MRITVMSAYSKTNKIYVFYSNGKIKTKRKWNDEMRGFGLSSGKRITFSNYGKQAIMMITKEN